MTLGVCFRSVSIACCCGRQKCPCCVDTTSVTHRSFLYKTIDNKYIIINQSLEGNPFKFYTTKRAMAWIHIEIHRHRHRCSDVSILSPRFQACLNNIFPNKNLRFAHESYRKKSKPNPWKARKTKQKQTGNI